jgi:hypothetical protein
MSGSLARMGRPSPSQRVESGSSPARAVDARRYRRATISLAPCRHLSRPIVAGRLRVASIGSPFSGRRAELAGRSRRVPLPQYASVPECLASRDHSIIRGLIQLHAMQNAIQSSYLGHTVLAKCARVPELERPAVACRPRGPHLLAAESASRSRPLATPATEDSARAPRLAQSSSPSWRRCVSHPSSSWRPTGGRRRP